MDIIIFLLGASLGVYKARNEPVNVEISSKDDSLSKRAKERMLEEGAGMSYLPDFFVSLSNQYHPIDNPSGALAVCIAENNLRGPKQSIANALNKHISSAEDCDSRDILNYCPTTGMLCLRKALVDFFCDNFHRGKHNVDPEDIFVTAGASAALTMLGLTIMDPGDLVFIPSPYYAGFDTDFKTVPGAVTMPVHMSDDPSKLTLSEEALTNAYDDAIGRGQRPRVLLINNPNNPMGACYTVEELRRAHRWARDHSMHLVCDEVFALSVWESYPSDRCFTSLPVALGDDFDEYCHTIWALSKDLCASGLRLGTVYTKNKSLMTALGNANIMSMTSNVLQFALTRMLRDSVWVHSFLDMNRKTLQRCYEVLQKSLPAVNVSVTPAHGAVFLWANFSAHLKSATFEEERTLYKCMVDAGVLLTPGEACHCVKPGFFRICYAWIEEDYLETAMKRMIRGITKYSLAT